MSVAKSYGQSERIAEYEVPDDELAIGSTLGSPKAVCIIKATGAIKKVFSTDIGKDLFGSLTWRAYDAGTGMHLNRETGGKFLIHPEHQEHHFQLTGHLSASENVYVLSGGPDKNGNVQPPGVYYTVTVTNNSDQPIDLSLYCYAELRGQTGPDVVAEYDSQVQGFIVHNEKQPNMVRVIGCTIKPDSYEVSQDAGKAVAANCPGTLSGDIVSCDRPLSILNHKTHLEPGENYRITYVMSFGSGRAEALRHYKGCPDPEKALELTKAYYHDMLERAILVTPNDEVNRGVLWAKANMLRILIKAPTGWCFVNDPTETNNSVARDTAWFAYGADYIWPEFSRMSLNAFVDRQEANGLIVEYYDILDGTTKDYGLNINDNTPLLILGIWHYFSSSGDRKFLKKTYPALVKAARYILSQRNEQGLVWCTADGTSDFGIIGWRNVIKNYRLSGATTEANSECFAALMTMSRIARVLDEHKESEEFGREAGALRDAINKHLKNPENGLYYLNIDLNGVPRSDVTSDLVFPVIFGVADDLTAVEIVRRLSGRDFWTPAGIRTTPRDAPDYNPDGKTDGPYGLQGGVWVGVSYWFAFAAAPYNAEFMDRALNDGFRTYSTDPRRNNTVPGQFSEWLHGETLANEGMMLSPWFPPRYLWAAIEGAGGLHLNGDEIELDPRLAPHWKWLGVRNLPYRGKMLSWLGLRMPGASGTEVQLFTTFQTQSETVLHLYEEDITEQLYAPGPGVCAIGLRHGRDILLFVGSTAPETVTTSVRYDGDLHGSFRVRRYDSLLSSWKDEGLWSAADIQQGQMIQIEQRGFCLLEMKLEN